MYRKNTAGQHIGFCAVKAADGTALTGATVTAKRSIDGAAQAATTGSVTELANGQYDFAPSAADLNGNNVSFLFTATSMIPFCIDVVTTAADPTDGTRFGLTALPNAAANAAGGLPVSAAGGLDLDEMNVDVEAIQASTSGLTFTVANKVDANSLAIGGTTQTGADVGSLATEINADVDEIITTVATIQTSTAGLTYTVANQVDANTLKIGGTTQTGADVGALATEINADADELITTLGTPTGASIAADIAEIEAETDLIPTTAQIAAAILITPANLLLTDAAGRVTTTFKLQKNTALANFEFPMVLTSDHVTPATGLSVTGQVSIDGGGFGALTNAVVEVANGVYKVNLAAADLNGNDITLKFTAATADQTLIGIVTQ